LADNVIGYTNNTYNELTADIQTINSNIKKNTEYSEGTTESHVLSNLLNNEPYQISSVSSESYRQGYINRNIEDDQIKRGKSEDEDDDDNHIENEEDSDSDSDVTVRAIIVKDINYQCTNTNVKGSIDNTLNTIYSDTDEYKSINNILSVPSQNIEKMNTYKYSSQVNSNSNYNNSSNSNNIIYNTNIDSSSLYHIPIKNFTNEYRTMAKTQHTVLDKPKDPNNENINSIGHYPGFNIDIPKAIHNKELKQLASESNKPEDLNLYTNTNTNNNIGTTIDPRQTTGNILVNQGSVTSRINTDNIQHSNTYNTESFFSKRGLYNSSDQGKKKIDKDKDKDLIIKIMNEKEEKVKANIEKQGNIRIANQGGLQVGKEGNNQLLKKRREQLKTGIDREDKEVSEQFKEKSGDPKILINKDLISKVGAIVEKAVITEKAFPKNRDQGNVNSNCFVF